jgi:hypothetical protein
LTLEDHVADEVIVQVQVNSASDVITVSADPVVTLQSSHERYYVSAWNPNDSNLLASGCVFPCFK